jgi:peptidyl-tRNA hydrolase
MSSQTIIVDGNITPEGMLVVEDKLQLPPGKVRVTVEQVAQTKPNQRSLRELFREIQEEQARGGKTGRTREEIDADVKQMRDEWEERMDEFARLQGGSQPTGE